VPNANLPQLDAEPGTVVAETMSPAGRPFYVIARHEKKRPEVRQEQRCVPVTYGVLDDQRPRRLSRDRRTPGPEPWRSSSRSPWT
jgi:hypothetical protein